MNRRHINSLLGIAALCTAGCSNSNSNYQIQKQSLLSMNSLLTSDASSSGDASGTITQPGQPGEPSPTPTPSPTASGTITQPGSPAPTPTPSLPPPTPTASGTITQPGTPAPTPTPNLPPPTPTTSGTITQPSAPPYFNNPGQTTIYVERQCSDQWSAQQINFKRGIEQHLPIVLQVNGAACSSDPTAIQGVIEKSNISIADVQALCPAVVPAKGQVNLSLLIGGQNFNNLYISPGLFAVDWATGTQGADSAQNPDQYCTLMASPLIIHLPSSKGFQPVSISSIAEGLFYDLLGEHNNHMPVRIGWFTNMDYAMLTLPNAKGQVLGIDQLFGNNTRGPDGHFADNGYHALGKYDSNGDGRIDAKDPIFSQLRLWKDGNFDGVAQPEELISLSDAGISFIDLDYSSAYREVDKYGNESRMKSVVGFSNGSLDLIFDLWFVYESLGGSNGQ